ncbi:MAG TPA: hypothetical protein VLJ68_02775 [Chitinophagaceae bacterium]|nr:hypothetical protein [Chitinophagaceae bacterium]
MENHDPVQIVKTKNVFVTRSLLVRKFSGIVDACLFPSMERKTRKKLSLYSALSLFKHRLRFWKNEDYYFVFNVWATGYYHWITEVAIKFVLFERELQSGVIIIPENCPHFISEFLLIMGISNTRQMKGNCYIKKLNIITNPVSGHPDPAHLEAFRSRVLLEVKEDGKKF